MIQPFKIYLLSIKCFLYLVLLQQGLTTLEILLIHVMGACTGKLKIKLIIIIIKYLNVAVYWKTRIRRILGVSAWTTFIIGNAIIVTNYQIDVQRLSELPIVFIVWVFWKPERFRWDKFNVAEWSPQMWREGTKMVLFKPVWSWKVENSENSAGMGHSNYSITVSLTRANA